MSRHNIRKIDDAGYALTAIGHILTDINTAKSTEMPTPEWYGNDHIIGGLHAAISALSDTIQNQTEILDKQAKQAEWERRERAGYMLTIAMLNQEKRRKKKEGKAD